MANGVILLSTVPVRKDPSDRSEMINQLLFGEKYQLINEEEKWLKIKSIHDNYEGWIDRKQHSPVSIDDCAEAPVCSISTSLVHSEGKNQYHLSPGSLIYKECHGQVGIGSEVYDIKGATGLKSRTDLNSLSRQFLNTPYLWGGRSIWGIDCSGLTQILFRMIGVSLYRDASQQVTQGTKVILEEATIGDLAFFNNPKGSITHVGMMLNNEEIIHASGRVRIDKLTNQGIIIRETGECSHILHSIRRV